MNRRLFIATTMSGALSACAPIGNKLNESPAFHRLLESGEALDERLIGTRGRAALYRPQDISANFPIDSFDTPSDSRYSQLLREGFRSYRLIVDGDVERPQSFSLSHLAAMMNAMQITRHDCVEGWSAIAQWQGIRLGDVIAMARPLPSARFAIFHTFDRDTNGAPYYESLSLEQAAHPQTLLALRQNGKPIAPERGAPVRLTVPTQLGYKSAKWVTRIQIASALSAFGSGKGGYWEDQGYEWYAGI